LNRHYRGACACCVWHLTDTSAGSQARPQAQCMLECAHHPSGDTTMERLLAILCTLTALLGIAPFIRPRRCAV